MDTTKSIQKIVAHHQSLVTFIDRALENSDDAQWAPIEQLITSWTEHCLEEYNLMLGIGYPLESRHAHSEDHAIIAELITKTIYSATDQELEESLHYLRARVVDHVEDFDRAYLEY